MLIDGKDGEQNPVSKIEVGQEVGDPVDLPAGPANLSQDQKEIDVGLRAGLSPGLRSIQPQTDEMIGVPIAQGSGKLLENDMEFRIDLHHGLSNRIESREEKPDLWKSILKRRQDRNSVNQSANIDLHTNLGYKGNGTR